MTLDKTRELPGGSQHGRTKYTKLESLYQERCFVRVILLHLLMSYCYVGIYKYLNLERKMLLATEMLYTLHNVYDTRWRNPFLKSVYFYKIYVMTCDYMKKIISGY